MRTRNLQTNITENIYEIPNIHNIHKIFWVSVLKERPIGPKTIKYVPFPDTRSKHVFRVSFDLFFRIQIKFS